jgi:hypothetical protein
VKEAVRRGMRKLHNEALHNLYSSPNISSDEIKENDMAGACSMHG